MNIFSNPLRLVYLAFAAALLLYLGGALQQCSSSSETALAANEGYLGDKACQSCHEEAYADWYGSHHDLAMAEAVDSTVLGDFNNATFISKGITSTMFKRDGAYYINTEGPDGELHDYRIDYTFGWYPLQQYMVEFPGGRIQCLHVAWDSRENKWFDLQPEQRYAPDDWMHWTGRSMTWNTMCADCHSTNLQKNYMPEQDSFHTTWSIIDVSCEACHGPGRQHLSYVSGANYKKGQRVPGAFMYLTSDLSSQEQVDQCARCHAFRSQHSPAFTPGEELLDSYVPELLRPGIYHPDGQILEEVYVYGSFLQSKMYRNNVQCTDCHNPHSLELVAVGNALCAKCHDPKEYDVPAHHFHEVNTDGAQCVSCHMPGKYYMVNDFRRDHSFRVPRPDLSVQYGMPNACNQCHTDKSAEWAAEAVVEWYGPERAAHYSDALAAANSGDLSVAPELIQLVADTGTAEIVRATAVWLLSSTGEEQGLGTIVGSLRNPDPLIRYTAVNALAPFSQEDRLRYLLPMVEDSIRSIRAAAAYQLADVPEALIPKSEKASFQAALAEYETVLDMQSDFPSGRLQKGQYFHRKGDLGMAEKMYRHAIDIDPYFPQPHVNLANLYYQQGELDKAEAAFTDALQVDSTNGEAWYSLGLLLAERERLQEAAGVMRRAAALTGNPRHFYNWGLILQNLNRPREAEQAYLAALNVYPDEEYLLYALAVLYLQQQQPGEAQPIIYRLLQLDPQNQQYQGLLRALRPG